MVEEFFTVYIFKEINYRHLECTDQPTRKRPTSALMKILNISSILILDFKWQLHIFFCFGFCFPFEKLIKLLPYEKQFW